MSRALGCQSLNDKLSFVWYMMYMYVLGTSIDVLVYPTSPHCDVENGELGVGDLVDQLCHHEEGSFVEGKSGAGKRSKATEGQ